MRRLIVLAVLLAGCSSGSGEYAAPRTSATTPATTPASVPGNALQIAGFSYQPNPLTVKPGATITVKNADSADHTVTADTGGAFDLTVSQGEPATFTAPSRAGTFAFHCSIHPSMHGTLVVAP